MMIYLHGLLDNIPRVDDFPSELNGSVSFREFPSHVWWPRYIMGGFDGSQTTSVSESWQTWIYESYCWLMLYSCILKLLVVDLLKILVINSSTKVTCICFFPKCTVVGCTYLSRDGRSLRWRYLRVHDWGDGVMIVMRIRLSLRIGNWWL